MYKALQFTPRLKGVLTRVLPILGNVKDIHRPIFANGMLLWFVYVLLLHIYGVYAIVPIDTFLNGYPQQIEWYLASSMNHFLSQKSQIKISRMIGLGHKVSACGTFRR